LALVLALVLAVVLVPPIRFKRAAASVLLTLATAAAAHDFTPCEDADTSALLKGSLCALHVVPLNHAAATESISLFIRKFPAAVTAKPSGGELWLLSGGPGESGATLYPFIDALRASFVGFDIIVPDHRGTGFSSRLCPKEEAPDSPGGGALEGAEWRSCFASLHVNAARTRQFNISNAARDLRSLLAARGPAAERHTATYLYAVSYGTQLVVRALQMGPLLLQGVVLDSLVPLEGDANWDLSRRSFVVDDVGRQVLAGCDADAACSAQLGESAALSYQRVLDRLDEGQLPASLLDKLPGKDLKTFLGSLLDWPVTRAQIPTIIKELDAGDGGALQAALGDLQTLASTWPTLPQMPVSVPLASLISGSENNQRPAMTVGAVRQANSRLLFTSPLPELLVQPGLPLYMPDKYFGKLAAAKPGQPPLLVLSGTLDAKTHWQAAQAHVAALRAAGLTLSWVSVAGAPHFILWTAPACFATQVQRFLLKAEMPPQLVCSSNP
jgi:pimeloyl-ACP methyl ester carboxylesterase